MNKPVLYAYYRSSCSWRVRIALEYKRIAYDVKPVNLIKDGGEQHSEEFKKLNPMAQVPALTIDGHTLYQSVSILEYLEEKYPDFPLLPKDLIARAKIRAIVETIASGIQPLQNLTIIKFASDKNWAHDVIHKGFVALEKMLATTASKYCYGDTITLADCCLVPQVYNARRYKVDLAPFPIIQRIDAILMENEVFAKTHPSKQIDCPPEGKV